MGKFFKYSPAINCINIADHRVKEQHVLGNSP
jgi:hypothetical protein